jgi:hypothetical protein
MLRLRQRYASKDCACGKDMLPGYADIRFRTARQSFARVLWRQSYGLNAARLWVKSQVVVVGGGGGFCDLTLALPLVRLGKSSCPAGRKLLERTTDWRPYPILEYFDGSAADSIGGVGLARVTACD